MLLNAARTPARVDGEGNLLRLREQDRTRWNQPMIARGMFHLAQSAAGGEISANTICRREWPRAIARRKITRPRTGGKSVSLYDRLLEFDDSPVVALNRAVALAEVRGPQAGIEAVNAIPDLKSLESYYLFHAVMGDFELQLNRLPIAARAFSKGVAIGGNAAGKEIFGKAAAGVRVILVGRNIFEFCCPKGFCPFVVSMSGTTQSTN